MKYRTAALVALVAGSDAAVADDVTPAASVICTPQPVICTTIAASSNDRFSPFVQHLLVRSQLESQPKGWQMVFLYVPSMDTRALEELQIRFLDELLARQKAEGGQPGESAQVDEGARKAASANKAASVHKSGDETDEGGVEEPHTWTKPPKEGDETDEGGVEEPHTWTKPPKEGGGAAAGGGSAAEKDGKRGD